MVSRCLLVRVRLISCSPYRRCLVHCPPTKWSCSILTGVSVDSRWVDNNNTQDDIHSAVIYSAKPYARVHFGSCERKSVCARWLQTCRPSWKLDLLSPRRMECWVDLDTAVSVQPMPMAAYRSDFHEKHRNLTAAWVRSWASHATGKRATARPLRPEAELVNESVTFS